MDNIMLILFLLSFVALIVGIIKPGLVVRWGDPEKRTRKNALKYYGLATVVFFVLFGFTTGGSAKNTANNTTPTSTSTEEQTTKDKKAAADMDNLITNLGTPETITLDSSVKVKTVRAAYNTLTDSQKALVTKYSILQALETKITALQAEADRVAYDTGITYEQLARTPDNYKGKKVKFTGKVIQVMEGSGETDLRIAVNGNYDTVLLVAYRSNITATRVLENDNVTIKGVSNGLYTYKSTLGGEITIPLVNVDIITINN